MPISFTWHETDPQPTQDWFHVEFGMDQVGSMFLQAGLGLNQPSLRSLLT